MNPHNPPPGGFRSPSVIPGGRIGHPAQMAAARWTTPVVATKSVEVQRSQMDDLFKCIRSGDELTETDPR